MIGVRNLDTETLGVLRHTGGDPVRTWQDGSHLQAKVKALPETNPADTMISDWSASRRVRK